MIQRILFLTIFALIGALGYGWWYNNYQIITVQQERDQERMHAFMAQGARFTAQDGQDLCERVRALEERSYGFKDAGKTPMSCDYGTQK